MQNTGNVKIIEKGGLGNKTTVLIDGVDVTSHVMSYSVRHEVGRLPVVELVLLNCELELDGECETEIENIKYEKFDIGFDIEEAKRQLENVVLK